MRMDKADFVICLIAIVIASVSFGAWMQSIWAGAFMASAICYNFIMEYNKL